MEKVVGYLDAAALWVAAHPKLAIGLFVAGAIFCAVFV